VTFDELWGTLLSIRRNTGTFVPQREMAQRMGTTQSHVSELESGAKNRVDGPGIEILERYANALGYVIVYDLKRVEEME
jgi:transcriptional regulator with XRE-family HTH domain